MHEPPLSRRICELLEQVGPDHEGALARMPLLYDAHVRFEDPFQSVDGIDAFVEVNRKFTRNTRRLSLKTSTPVGDDAEFYFTWTMHFAPRIGPQFTVEGVSHARSQGGKVVYQRDYWDAVSLLASGVPGGRALLRLLMRAFT